jgi:hypothetical protein
MASIGGLIYGFLFGAVIIVAFMLFIGSLQNQYSANILAGNLSNNNTFANTSGIFSNQTSGFYTTINSTQDLNAGTGTGASIQGYIFMIVPGSQWAWNAIGMFFTIITGYTSLASDLLNAFSIAGFPAGWLALIVGTAITAFVGLEILGWMGKYKLQ